MITDIKYNNKVKQLERANARNDLLNEKLKMYEQRQSNMDELAKETESLRDEFKKLNSELKEKIKETNELIWWLRKAKKQYEKQFKADLNLLSSIVKDIKEDETLT